jgi:hypothetical protein
VERDSSKGRDARFRPCFGTPARRSAACPRSRPIPARRSRSTRATSPRWDETDPGVRGSRTPRDRRQPSSSRLSPRSPRRRLPALRPQSSARARVTLGLALSRNCDIRPGRSLLLDLLDAAEAQEAGRRIVRENARALYRLESAFAFRLPRQAASVHRSGGSRQAERLGSRRLVRRAGALVAPTSRERCRRPCRPRIAHRRAGAVTSRGLAQQR